jgi:DNA-binding protein WhiA
MASARPAASHDTTERELVAGLRAELASIEPTRRCCRVAERAGLGAAAEGRARTPLLGRLAVRLDDAVAGDFEWQSAAEHCRKSYLRGLLLARGSLSTGPAGTHLEVVVAADDLEVLGARFAEAGFAAHARIRRGRGVLTWKSADTIVGLLRYVGASGATLELEARFIGRALNAHMNRIVNAEHSNLRRAVSAARRQLADIDTLDRRGLLRKMPTKVRRVAEARRRAPEQTFGELAQDLDMSRSQVQRAFEMIGGAALHTESP